MAVRWPLVRYQERVSSQRPSSTLCLGSCPCIHFIIWPARKQGRLDPLDLFLLTIQRSKFVFTSAGKNVYKYGKLCPAFTILILRLAGGYIWDDILSGACYRLSCCWLCYLL